MKKVRILKMALLNFKGIKQLEVTFNGITKIYGDNATGKTTLVDAFTWLLFGKDSTGRKDFSIKTFDHENNTIHKLDHEVSGQFDVDGEVMTLRRVYREKWVTRRGSQDAELQGHETLFFWNDVPMQAGEYQSKVDSIISEDTFRMITSPLYFNTLKWQDRRNILVSIAGDVSDKEIAMTRLDFSALVTALGNKTIDELKRELAAKKKKLKDELAQIPARIDEVTRNTPETKDWKWIEDEIQTIRQNISIIDSQLQDSSKIYDEFYKAKQQRQQQIHNLKTKVSDYEFEASKEFGKFANEKSAAIENAKKAIDQINRQVQFDIVEIENLKLKIADYEKEQAQLRDEWIKLNSESFPGFGDENNFVCPTCKQQLPSGDIEKQKSKIRENFEENKAKKLADIQAKGKSFNPMIEALKNRVSLLESTDYESSVKHQEQIIKEWEGKHMQSIQIMLSSNSGYQTSKNELEQLNSLLLPEEPIIDNSALNVKKTELQNSIDGLKRDLSLKTQIEQANNRKSELLRQEKEFAKQLSELEQTEFTIQEFTRAKVDMLETKINNMFEGVKFRLFDTQLNGGLIECCDTLINGVPWLDANNAARINGGISIINVLAKHYGQIAPIWIDNSESITSIQNTESQRIELYVSEAHKKLQVA